MKEESAKQEHTIEDYKKWFNQECEENLKLKEEIRETQRVYQGASGLHSKSLVLFLFVGN